MPNGPSNFQLVPNDPIHVKMEIGLNDVKDNLFTIIHAGVRFWPYLIVARDLERISSERQIVTELKNIKKRQEVQIIGPGTIETFDFYRRMYRRIRKSTDTNVKDLKDFINDRRRTYTGDFAIFNRNGNNVKWRKALIKSTGEPGKQFASLLDSLIDNGNEDIVEDAVTHILKSRKPYNEWLWHGAFCYVFLRCMYGIGFNDAENKQFTVTNHNKSSVWADTLIEILSNAKAKELSNLKKYIPLIRQSKIAPPWKNTTRSLKASNRIVLSNIKFDTFYNLYSRQKGS